MVCAKKSTAKTNIITLLKMCALSIITGVTGGLIGNAFLYVLTTAAHTRAEHTWLIFLLPAGGIATVMLYRLLKMSNHGGVNEIVKNIEYNTPVRPLAAPLIFVCTAITHLLGGSAGKEGAALQLGGAGAAAIAKGFKLKDNYYAAMVLCGMSAVFASVFGTPLTAAFFILEFKATRKIFPWAVLPCFISALTADRIAALTGRSAEAIPYINSYGFNFATVAKAIILSVCVSITGAVMCLCFKSGKRIAKTIIKNPIIRILAGSAVIIALTLITGDMRYNGSGMEMAIKALEGNADWYDFMLKIVFTAITLSAGFKGGEIVPTFCIGATFGCVMGQVLGINPALAAALGLVAIFCYATNSLISAVFLGIELFGIALLPYFIIVCLVACMLSGKHGLFYGRIFKSPIFILKQKLKTTQ